MLVPRRCPSRRRQRAGLRSQESIVLVLASEGTAPGYWSGVPGHGSRCRPGALTGRARLRAIRGSNHPSLFLTGARREHRGRTVRRENEAIRLPPSTPSLSQTLSLSNGLNGANGLPPPPSSRAAPPPSTSTFYFNRRAAAPSVSCPLSPVSRHRSPDPAR